MTTAKTHVRRGLAVREAVTAYGLLTPALLGVLAFLIVPIIMLVTSVWAIALALPHRDYGPVGSAPLALTAVIAGSTAIGVVAALTGVSLLSQPWLVWAIVSVLVVWTLMHRRRTAATSWAARTRTSGRVGSESGSFRKLGAADDSSTSSPWTVATRTA